jgi:hypothetical protein
LVVTNTKTNSVTVRLQLTAYCDRNINPACSPNSLPETKYAEVTVNPVPRTVVVGRVPYDYEGNRSSRITSSEPSAPQPAGSFSFTFAGKSDGVQVESGTPITLDVGHLVNMDPNNLTFECAGNSEKLVKLTRGGVTYCGDPDPNNINPNGPFPMDLNNLPTEIVFVKDNTSETRVIAVTCKGNDTSGNSIQRSIAVTVYPAGITAPGSNVRNVLDTINSIVAEIPETLLKAKNAVGLFLLKTIIRQ